MISKSMASGLAYAPYTQNIRNLAKSAQRLATGEKYIAATDGSGQLGIADRMRNNIRGASALLSSMQDAIGYSSTQDEILGHVADIVARMNELAAAGVDSTKTSDDREALHAEYTALSTEVADIANKSRYNGQKLFDTTLTIRVGVEATDIVSFSAVALSLLTFGAGSLSTAAKASLALSTLAIRAASLAILRNRSRSHNVRIERAVNYTQSYLTNLQSAESAIRDIDVALETGEFTKQQVMVSAGQAVIAQSNNLIQGAQRFLN